MDKMLFQLVSADLDKLATRCTISRFDILKRCIFQHLNASETLAIASFSIVRFLTDRFKYAVLTLASYDKVSY